MMAHAELSDIKQWGNYDNFPSRRMARKEWKLTTSEFFQYFIVVTSYFEEWKKNNELLPISILQLGVSPINFEVFSIFVTNKYFY